MMWVRSYFSYDQLLRDRSGKEVAVASRDGEILFMRYPVEFNQDTYWVFVALPLEDELRVRLRTAVSDSLGLFGFGYRRSPNEGLFVPYWFLTLGALGLAIVSKPPPRLRFSLAEVFALLTFAAIAAALVAWVARLGSDS